MGLLCYKLVKSSIHEGCLCHQPLSKGTQRALSPYKAQETQHSYPTKLGCKSQPQLTNPSHENPKQLHTLLVLATLIPPPPLHFQITKDFPKTGKAFSVIAEASAIPMHLQELTSEIFKYVQLSSFHTCSLFYLPTNECWIVLSHPQMPYYSSILPLGLVNGAPCALIAKTKSN